MRLIAHISDLHFGHLNEATLPALRAALDAAKPDLLVVSGDLTQRARTRQFQEAKHFLDTLAPPKLIVPGNHDVPLYDVLARWRRPLVKYRRYITDDLSPFYGDDEIAVAGINTARALTIKNGRINQDQLERIGERLAAGGDRITRVIVTHHPFDLPVGMHPENLVGRAERAMDAFLHSRVDLILSGHLHASQATESVLRYGAGHAALLVQAGTATSSRTRDEPNAFNLIRIERAEITPEIIIETMTWNPDRENFARSATDRFQRNSTGWARQKTPLSHALP